MVRAYLREVTIRAPWQHGRNATEEGSPVVDHRTGFQKVWATVLGIVLLVGGVIFAGIFFGDVALTVVGGIVAVIGLGLLRYALMRRRRLAQG
jgi:hypothetical protein